LSSNAPSISTLKGETMSMSLRQKHLEVRDVGDITVVLFIGRTILDNQIVQAIGEKLFSLVDELDRRKIIINLTNVKCLSSAAFGKLISLQKKIVAANGKLMLCNVDKHVSEVFETLHINRLFNIVEEEQEAMKVMQSF